MAESTQAGQVPNGSTADSEAMRQQIEEQQRLINELLEGRSGSLAGTVVRAPNAPPNEQGSQQPSTPYADYSGVDGMTNPLVSDLDRDGEWEADAAYARHLQELEMMTSVEIEDPESNRPKLVDPVWGSFEAPARGHRPHQVLCIALCPCCVRPCCSPERKQSWKRVLRSMSFILGTLQVLLVIGSLFVRGFAPTELNPMLGPWPDTLDAMGAKNAAKIILRGQVHRFFLPMLLHAGFVHLAMNVLMQLRLGVMLEFQWGWKMYAPIYVLAGLYSAVMSTWFIPNSIGVGASGALMGLMGAWLVDIIITWNAGTDAQRQGKPMQLVMCVVNMLVVLGFSMVPYIDWAAHAFGMLGGLLAALVLFGKNLESTTRKRWLQWGGAVAYALTLTIALIFIFTDVEPNKNLLYICEAERMKYPQIKC